MMHGQKNIRIFKWRKL